MKRNMIVIAVALFAALAAWGQAGEVQVTLKVLTRRVLLAEPLFIEICLHNGTGAPISLSTYDGQGFTRRIVVRKPDGSVAAAPWPSRDMPMEPLTPGQTALFQDDLQGSEILLFTVPGKYELWAEYESPGRVYEEGQVYGQRERYQDYWKGALKSNTAELEAVAPQGEDRQAYDRWLKPYATKQKILMSAYQGQENVVVNGHEERHPVDLLNEIFRQFPTSTYAAYVVWDRSHAKGLAASDPAKVAEALTSGMGLMGEIWVPVPGARDKSGLAPLSGQAAVEWRQKWFGIVLKSHPDIWFADALRLKLAVDQAALRNYQAAQADLEAIAKDDKARMAPKAKEYLSLMKQKGWIKE